MLPREAGLLISIKKDEYGGDGEDTVLSGQHGAFIDINEAGFNLRKVL